VKNKVAPPFKEAEFDILYGTGISHEGELVDLGAESGIIEKSGAWYAFDSERIGQGRENTKDFLREHPEMAQSIEQKVRAQMGLTAGDGGGESPAPAQAGRAEPPKSDAKKTTRGA
jgi:recombination protein RecA